MTDGLSSRRKNRQMDARKPASAKQDGRFGLRSWLTRRRWLIQLGLMFLLTSLVMTALLLVLVSRLVSGQLVNQTDAANRELLGQTYSTIDYTLTDVYSEYYQLWRKDPDIRAILSAGDSTVLTTEQDALVSARLRFSADQTKLVHSIYLISFSHNRVWSSRSEPSTLTDLSDLGAAEFLAAITGDFEKHQKDVFFARKAMFANPAGSAPMTASPPENGESLINVKANNILSFFFVQRQADGQFGEVLLVNLDRDKFSSLIKLHSDNGFIILVSPSGDIIADTSERWIESQISSLLIHPATFDNIVQSSQTGGSLIAATSDGQSLVTWQKAGTMGFFLLDITPMDRVYREVTSLNHLIAIYFAAALIISLGIGLWSVRRLYRPLQGLVSRMNQLGRRGEDQLMDEFASLDAAYQEFERRENQSAIHSLINGVVTESARQLFADNVVLWVGLVIMPIQDHAIVPEQIQLIHDRLRRDLGTPTVIFTDDCFVVLLSGEEGVWCEPDEIRRQVEPILQTLAEDYQTIWVIGAGVPVDQLGDCRTTYRQALIAASQARLVSDEHSSSAWRIQFYQEMGLAAGGPKNTSQSVANQVMAIISDQLANPDLSADRVAEMIGLSTGYLRQLFKQETGKTINDHLSEVRIQRACELLKLTDQTAREIALAVGYIDSRYFYTLFKKRTGLTTEQYRQQSRRS